MGRPRSVVTVEFIRQVIAMIRDGPDKTILQCAKALSVSRSSVEKAILESDRCSSAPAVDSHDFSADRR